MPTQKIEVTEYECTWCHYRWINRVNGKDGPVPQRCAKCKRYGWNDGKYVDRNPNPITDEERGLRMRLYKFEGSRYNDGKPFEHRGIVFQALRQYRPNELCQKFLSLKPRPTIKQLKYVLEPLGPEVREMLREYTKSRFYREMLEKHKPELHKKYEEALQLETQRRREYMQQVIQSRQGQEKEASPIQKEAK
jgi:hypothetical protein